MATSHIWIGGDVRKPASLSESDLAVSPGQIADVSLVIPGRQGVAVRLGSLLESAGVNEGVTHITLTAEGGRFSASVPLAAVEGALIVYRLGGDPLPRTMGGPFRFLIPDARSCRDVGAAVDLCANVKFLEKIELTRGPGRDTRPSEEERDRRHGKHRG